MVICVCGATLKTVTPAHLNSKIHHTNLKKLNREEKVENDLEPQIQSKVTINMLEKRIKILEMQMSSVLDNLSLLNEKQKKDK